MVFVLLGGSGGRPPAVVIIVWLYAVLAMLLVDDVGSELVVGGYLPDYRFYISVNETALGLTDLMLFSIDPAATGSLIQRCCLDDHHLQVASQARAYKRERQPDAPPLRLWLTLGGAGRSSGFSTLATKLDAFVASVVDLCHKYGLDGIDFDGEHVRSTQEYREYLQFLYRVAVELKKRGILVSVALHPRQYLVPQLYEVVDRVNLMAYDMIMGESYHASVRQTQSAVESLLQSGCPPEKLVVGIPAYARHETNPGSVKTIAEIYDASHAWSGDNWQGFRYESKESVREKVELVRTKGLDGIFIWELGQDKATEDAPSGVLLQAIADEVHAQETTKAQSSEL